MFKPIQALCLELFWKNRIIIPALAALWILGAYLAHEVAGGRENDPGLVNFRLAGFFAFLASIFLGLTPFTLMESEGSWKLNSMTTRWSVLPMPTVVLVAVPLLLGWLWTSFLFGVWSSVLQKLLPGVDPVYELLLLLWLVTVTQAAAWTMPRKPGQFWFGLSLIAIAGFWLAFAPPQAKQWDEFRPRFLVALTGASVVSALLAWAMARWLRLGAWSGGFSFSWAGSADVHRSLTPQTPLGALMWAESRPLLRAFTWSWIAAILFVTASILLIMHQKHPAQASDWRWLIIGWLNHLQLLAVIWLAPWAIMAACHSPGVFKTSLTSFRASQPITASMLASPKLLAMLVAYGLIWIPLGLLLILYQKAVVSLGGGATADQLHLRMVWGAAISAHAMAGLLPLLFTGRLDGLPNLIVPTLISWAGTWAVADFVSGDEGTPQAVWVLLGLILVKIFLAGGALGWALRTRNCTWRFALGLFAVWFGLSAFLGAALWQSRGLSEGMAMFVLIPIARPAWCVIGLTLNRRR